MASPSVNVTNRAPDALPVHADMIMSRSDYLVVFIEGKALYPTLQNFFSKFSGGRLQLHKNGESV